MYNVKPGDKAVIIDSVNGKNGPSVGRIVLVHANNPEHPEYSSEHDEKYSESANNLNDPKHYCPPSRYEKEHTVHGKIWPVTCVKGQPFVNNVNGALMNVIDVPDKFLKKIIEDKDDSSINEKKELEVD